MTIKNEVIKLPSVFFINFVFLLETDEDDERATLHIALCLCVSCLSCRRHLWNCVHTVRYSLTDTRSDLSDGRTVAFISKDQVLGFVNE